MGGGEARFLSFPAPPPSPQFLLTPGALARSLARSLRLEMEIRRLLRRLCDDHFTEAEVFYPLVQVIEYRSY